MDLNKAYNLVTEKLQDWLEQLISMLPNLVVASIVFVIFIVLAKFARKVSFRLIKSFSHKDALNKLFSQIIYVFVFAIGTFLALSILELDKAVTSLLAGAGIIGLALGFAFQDIASNFISGIFLVFQRPFRSGDIIESNSHMGVVDHINLRDTIITTFQGQKVFIPNKEIFQNSIVNYTKLGKRRVDLTVGVSYGDDLEKVRDVTLKAVESLPFLVENETVTLFFSEFADSSINFYIRFWVNFSKQTDFLYGRSEAIISIKKAFDQNDITIPFPIRTLDFGIKGGEKLNEDLSKLPIYQEASGNGKNKI